MPSLACHHFQFNGTYLALKRSRNPNRKMSGAGDGENQHTALLTLKGDVLIDFRSSVVRLRHRET